jgi:phage terminase large subunit
VPKPFKIKATKQDCVDALEAWKKDPVVRHYSFSDKILWAKQVEALIAYRNNKRTAIKSGNTVGKTFLSADIVMDFLTINGPQAKVVTTAPTWTQVEDVLWKEIAGYCNSSKIPTGGTLLKTQLSFSEEWFAVGISTDEPVRFQGRHSPHLLVIIDEASGITREIWEIIDALHPEKVVAIGNPLDNVGPFFEAFSSPLWHKITISCRECVDWQKEHGEVPGLVTQEWINEAEQIHGKNSPWVQAHVDGEFPDEAEGTLISRKWVEDCRANVLEEDEEDHARIISVDVASKHGECETVFTYRYGNTVARSTGHLRIDTPMQRDIISQMWSYYKATDVVVDSDGMGEGLPGILGEKNIPCWEFHGGYAQKAYDDTKFRNLRTQFYYMIAKKFEKRLYDLSKLPEKEYEILKNQLCCIRLKPPDGRARIQIETKEDLSKRGIKSPDHADALMMSEYAFWMGRYQEVKEMAYR